MLNSGKAELNFLHRHNKQFDKGNLNFSISLSEYGIKGLLCNQTLTTGEKDLCCGLGFKTNYGRNLLPSDYLHVCML